MRQTGDGYWKVAVNGIKPKTKYLYLLDKGVRKPDPASYFQPEGVFGPSAVIDQNSFDWTNDDWRGLHLEELIFYEIHTGTFSAEGTFKGIQKKIRELKEIGINAIELMPLTQFTGKYNWGYDGVFQFAIQNTYGEPDDFKALVNECHNNGLALFVDFVYNHFGPEGNVLNDFAPYFSSEKKTPWGSALNLDGPNCAGVRNFLIQNSLHWLRDYHIDGIRLDAILFMYDQSQPHFLSELNQTIKNYSKQCKREIYTIAESGFNLPCVLDDFSKDGWGFDGQWLDDFQHSLFALITGEREGYYRFYGQLSDFVDTLTEAYSFVGDQSSFRRREKNQSFRSIPASRFVVFSQNHDQIGNRMFGDRLISISGFESAKLALSMVLLSPYVPLLFMGEEYGETAPFQFFTDYQGKELQEAVVKGRSKEFEAFHWKGEVPNPQNPETFEKSKLNWNQRYQPKGAQMMAFIKDLLLLRKQPAFRVYKSRKIGAIEFTGKVLSISKGNNEAVVIANFGEKPEDYIFSCEGKYQKTIDSYSECYDGPGEVLPKELALKTRTTIPSCCVAVYNRLKL